MADGNDRYDNEGGGGGSFVMGLLTGTVLGAGLGMLFAPKSGSDLRNQLSEQAGNLRDTASEGYRRATEAAGDWAEKGRDLADKGRDLADKARDAVSRGADEAQRYAREVTGAAPGTGTGSSTGSTGSGPSYGSSSSGSQSGSGPNQGGARRS
jgi:gas vesicle protein